MMRLLQIQYFINLAILVMIASTKSSLSATPPSFAIAKPNCDDRCGNLNIPYPFGTTPNCYLSDSFLVTCNRSINAPKLFITDSPIEITDISLDGQLRVPSFIAHDCYNRNGTSDYYNGAFIRFPPPYIVNNTANKFTVIGCDSYGYVKGYRLDEYYSTGCIGSCQAKEDLIEGSCTGVGCCQTSIPDGAWEVNLTLGSFENHSSVWSFNNCSYAFLSEASAFTFSSENLTNLRNVEELPMVVDWAIGNVTCEEAKKNVSSYACKSVNSRCYERNNSYRYRCSCLEGYQGNPYLLDGCEDVNECENTRLNICEKTCVNTMGSFTVNALEGTMVMGQKVEKVAFVVNCSCSNLLQGSFRGSLFCY